ncbi:recombination-associated protein RdgC [Marinobacter sp. DS40M6]|uniref:recombination-associated protein RdgC n=1 Tax=Marinobacter sp. DS40M6 TaxID=1597776 RepID=UPI002358EF64|nr:recombination-associated protein RdgC [Marinobacter sp. DS40M6]MDC8457803.1 recombination-associated protein RdgC [Marinobacter sp. DS40M6]
MMFKNAVIFTFTKEWFISQGDLESELWEELFKPVGSQEIGRTGWVPALPGDEYMVFDTNECLFLRLRSDKKVLKESAIKRKVEDITSGIEREQGRKVRKKEKEEIRETVILEHLPHALIDSTYTVGYIDLKKQWLIVEASSFKGAEEFASFLRRTLGSLPVRAPALENSVGFELTGALDPHAEFSRLTSKFDLGEECTMVGIDGEKANFKDMDLTSEEVTNHITDSAMSVSSLRLAMEDDVAFTLTEDFRVKKIKFLDQFQEDVLNFEPEDEDIDAGLSYARTTLFLMTGTFRVLFDALIESMGGIEEDFDPLEGL